MIRVILMMMLAACGALMSGCTAAAIAAAGTTVGFGLAQGQAEAFINGELKAARMVTLDQAEHAAVQALEELQVRILTHRRGRFDSYIMAKADGGPEIKVTLTHKSPVITKIETRVGIVGDQAVSRLVMARIDTMLGIEQVIPVELSPIVAPRPAPPSREPPPEEPKSADIPPPPGAEPAPK